MDWEYIEAVFAQEIEFTHASREEVLDALSCLEQELGLDWIKTTKAKISNSSTLGRMVQFAKCLEVADVVAGGNSLKRKLRTDYLSEPCQGAIAEALIAERLLTSGATVQYEPRLPGMARRPDLFADWGTKQVAFEVVFPALSSQDAIENRRLSSMVSQCAEIVPSGTLNIYLTKTSISQEAIDSVVAAVRLLSNDATRHGELHLPDKAYLAYDPAIQERIVTPPGDLSREDAPYAFPLTDPEYHEVKARLKVLTPMISEAAISAHLSGGRFLRAQRIVRIYRPVMDPRALGKAEKEYAQLPADSAGVVVIDMSRTSMSLRPEEWATDMRDSFGPDLYPRMSAVWLRSGQPEVGTDWQEWLIVNPYATIELPTNIAKQLIKLPPTTVPPA